MIQIREGSDDRLSLPLILFEPGDKKDKEKLVASNFIEKILPMSEKHDAFRYNITGFIGNIVLDEDMTREIMSAGNYIQSYIIKHNIQI